MVIRSNASDCASPGRLLLFDWKGAVSECGKRKRNPGCLTYKSKTITSTVHHVGFAAEVVSQLAFFPTVAGCPMTKGCSRGQVSCGQLWTTDAVCDASNFLFRASRFSCFCFP
ncbi:hypothetical protein Droror1_Dr00004866 [Drosera rotundifolia]